MTYEKLTTLNLETEETPVLSSNGKTVYGKVVPKLAEALYDSGLAVKNYREVLDAAGIACESADPNDYNIEDMDADLVLALLTAIARADRFNEGASAICLESGLIEELIGRLADIDYENRPFPAWIEEIADKTLADLKDFPRVEETWVGHAIQPHLRYEEGQGEMRERTLPTQEEFDIVDVIHRKAKDYGLYLDSSAYEGMTIGLPISIPFRVRRVPVGSDGPTVTFRFDCGGFVIGHPTIEIREFLDEIEAVLRRSPIDPEFKTLALSDEQLKALQDVLVKIGAPEWDEEYMNLGVLDGTQWKLSFMLDGRHYHSEGSNAFPDGFDRLVDYLNAAFGCSF